MKRLLLLLFLFMALGAHAQELVTATVTVTNLPIDGDALIVNANTRTWTNTPLNGVSWISITNTVEAAATNLYLHVAATPFTALTLGYSSSTAITLQGSVVNVSFAGTWASVSYATQAVTSLLAVRVPMAGLPQATNRTIIASQLVTGISDYSTNAFSANAAALTNYLSLGAQAQIAVGPKHFESLSGVVTGLTNGIIDGAIVTNGIFAGTVRSLTSGLWTGGTLDSPTLTNGINYGNAFISNGEGIGSQQYGVSAEAVGLVSLAIGSTAKAYADGSVAIGFGANVYTNAGNGVALGTIASAQGLNSTALGTVSIAAADGSTALGTGAQALHTNSIALGSLVLTTANDQIRVGHSGYTLSVPGDGHFGQKVAVGSDNFAHWIDGLNRGIAFANGSSPNAPATNSWVAYAEAGQAFYRTGATSEGAEANNRLHNRGATVTGTGTAYSLTASTARVDFSGQDPEVLLPTAGTYFVSALVEIVNGATASDEYRVKFRNFEDDVDITDSERAISHLPASTIGQLSLQNVITVNDSKTIVLWGHNATAARGTIAAARTSLTYVRLH